MNNAMRSPIEHPIVFGKSNKDLLDTMSKAYAAALDLADKGFEVMHVGISRRVGVVQIKNSSRCTRLKSATKITRVGPFGRERVMAAQHKGAQIEWIVRGN